MFFDKLTSVLQLTGHDHLWVLLALYCTINEMSLLVLCLQRDSGIQSTKPQHLLLRVGAGLQKRRHPS